MYNVLLEKSYVKQLKKISLQKNFDKVALDNVVDLLASGGKLSARYKDHRLSGKAAVYRECHIKSDLLLKYYKDDGMLVLVLIEIGTHSQMFGK